MYPETSLRTEHADHPICVGTARENTRESTAVLIVVRYVNI